MKANTLSLIWLLLVCCCYPHMKASAQAPAREADSLALVELYTAMGGNSWLHRQNWLSAQAIHSWEGVMTVEVQDGDKTLSVVWRLILRGLPGDGPGKLRGVLPDLNLPNLELLDLRDNAIIDIAGLEGIPPDAFLMLSGNKLSFEVLERLEGKRYLALAQDTLLPLQRAQEGEGLRLSVIAGGSANRYQWMRNDEIVADASSQSHFIETNGRYSCIIENEKVKNVSLNSELLIIADFDEPVARERDSLALVLLYQDCNGPTWHRRKGWLTELPIAQWEGVHSDTVRDEGALRTVVTALELANNGLAGDLPDLDLANLVLLDLERNDLTGVLQLTRLPALRSLNVSFNEFSGEVPLLTGSPLLQLLDISVNQFTSSLPAFSHAGLRELKARNAGLSGQLPKIDWPQLELLSLSDNAFSGSLPELHVPRIETLLVYNTELSGRLPDIDLPELRVCNLANNRFTGPLPVLNTPRIEVLALGHNLLSGELPLLQFAFLHTLNIFNNQFSGPLPLFELPALETLNIGENDIHGPLPALNIPHIEDIVLQGNAFSSLPAMGAYEELDRLILSRNKLSFGDVELLPALGFRQLAYEVQDTVLPVRQIVENNSFRLETIARGEFNTYQWYRNRIAVPAAQSAVMSAATSGEYFCLVRNERATGMILSSDTVIVDLALPVPEDGDAADGLLLTASPNPFSERLVISYRPARATTQRLSIVNTLGEELALIHDGYLAPGLRQWELDSRLLSRGLYFLVLRGASDTATVGILRID